ncbi:low affinity vacuolar monovalent cation/H(+) antiporter-like [Tachyglossus aculeatus]|uniref:low affinity vacuolar monovalent cation/H(+) antiporter-like n=1 Tax=Tachyglossus aculeatus TaxID=9261 RepID=UPI0018F5EB60|nr:low affinity vacuolar monovalent cation/H(+) antiporter-like [Tachyglossus aculeatus]
MRFSYTDPKEPTPILELAIPYIRKSGALRRPSARAPRAGRRRRGGEARRRERERSRLRASSPPTMDFHQECPLKVRHRCGSLCDQRRAIDNAQARFVHSSGHQCGILTPRILPALASPVCCHHQSDENLESASYRLKTTILAENEVEANKLSNNYKFGFKKWKSHVTARPWEDRSEITKELYSDLCVVQSPLGSTVTCGNVFYLLLFGWWVSLVYLLVSVVMFLSVLGAPYGKLSWSLAGYFLWPFGKVIQKPAGSRSLFSSSLTVSLPVAWSEWFPSSPGAVGGVVWDQVSLSPRTIRKLGKAEVFPELNAVKETSPLLCHSNPSREPAEGCTSNLPASHWHRLSTYIWLFLGFPILVVTHGLVCCCSWLLVIIIPIAKMSVRTVTRVLLEAPERVHVQHAEEYCQPPPVMPSALHLDVLPHAHLSTQQEQGPSPKLLSPPCQGQPAAASFQKVLGRVGGLGAAAQKAQLGHSVLDNQSRPPLSGRRVEKSTGFVWWMAGWAEGEMRSLMPVKFTTEQLLPLAPVASRAGARSPEQTPPPQPPFLSLFHQTEISPEGDVLLCCHQAANVYYYKYSVDGINVFAVNLLPLVIVTLVLGYMDSQNQYTSSPVKFTLSLLSIVPLSYYIGMAIASISAQSTFAVGAVVNATFGSVVELTFYVTALIKGAREGNGCYEEVVKAALTGTMLGCTLLVPGLCMVIGGIRHPEQRFNSRSAGVSSALLFLSVGGVFAPTLFSKVYGRLICDECHNVTRNPPGHYLCQTCHLDLMGNNGTLYYSHVQPLVYTVSLLLPFAYLIGLLFTLKTHSHIYDIHVSDLPGHHRDAVVHWPRWRALLLLLLSTLCMSACADLATEHISPILGSSTVSQYFIGVSVLAMVPELPEIVNGIQFALQNNLSLSIEIGNCIAVQVCMLQIPILVLFSIFYPTGFKLLFSDLHVYASMFSVVLMNYIFMDGKCDYFQGTVLVMVYLILLAVYFFAPSPAGC